MLIYCQGYFLLGDSLNTTVTVISTLQNSVVAYNTLQLTYLLIVGIAAQVGALNMLPCQVMETDCYRLLESTLFGLSSEDTNSGRKPCSTLSRLESSYLTAGA